MAQTETTLDLSGPIGPSNIKDGLDGQFERFFHVAPQFPDARDWFRKQSHNVKPWTEFVCTSNLKVPPTIPRVGTRIKRNIDYFYGNYLFVFIGLIIYCLVTSPMILLTVAGNLYACYYLNKCYPDKNVTLCGAELSKTQLYALVGLCFLPIFYLVGVHAAIFWVLGASFFFITVHAAFYNIDAVSPQQPGLFEDV